ncbi:hypothetical protein KAS79_01795 [Candidatus Parcubacteria bacterium]|nr:hypothetical protein [Candidatus Parcubacteria bacterium]
MKVLFYTNNLRSFRASLIGHLFEIAQVYPTILLSEELDSETETAVKNKELFPKLEKIIPVRQFTGPEMNLFDRNKHFYRLAEEIIKEYKPDVVILGSDMQFIFELYLARFAKETNALVLSMQALYTFNDIVIQTKWVDLTNAYLRFPLFLPLWFRLFLVKCRKYFGHFLYYWILPILAREKPFFGKSSFILRKGLHGMRDADYQIVFSKRDYLTFRNVYLKYGVPVEKLYILSHPLAREIREFFERVYFSKFREYKKDENNTKIIAIMLPETKIGFKRKDYSLIPGEKKEKVWLEIIESINQIFPEYKIFIKPHPDNKNIKRIKEKFESISDNIKVVNPQEPADKYIEIADIVIGLPLSASSTLFTASLQCPGKPIISLDFHKELLGDVYQNFNGIAYIDNKDKFLNLLKLIRDNRYYIKKDFNKINKTKLETTEFLNTVEMLKYLACENKKKVL